MKPGPQEITKLLKIWTSSDQTALERLMPMVYDELHRLAHQHMRREQPRHMLQTSALINEAYLHLVYFAEYFFGGRNCRVAFSFSGEH